MTLTKVGEWLIEDAAQNADRCFRLCECAGDTRTPFFKQVMDHLLNVDISSWSSEERLRVWDKLRDVHTHHSNYKSQPQAMPEPMLQLLEGPMRRFEPTDPETHYRWVFGGAHPLPREEREDYHALQERLTDEGATAILTATGTEGIMRMVDKVENPWWLGYATGRVVHSPADEFVLLGWSLANEDQKLRSFGKGLVSGLFKTRGWDWAHTLFASAEWPDWTAAKRGALLSVLPFDDATWTVVQTHGAEIEAAYWSTCEPWGTLSPAQAQFAGEHFLKHGRPLRALIAIIHQGHGEDCTAPTPLITAALEACTKTYREESKEVHMPSYTITEAHKIVRQRDDADRQRVALIEWVFFPLLDEKDLILYAEMAKDPVPFADFLGYFSKPTEPSDIELTEQDRNIARRAYEVLSGWKGAPAVAQDGTLSFEALDEWYTKAVAKQRAGCGATTSSAKSCATPLPTQMGLGHALLFAAFSKSTRAIRLKGRLQLRYTIVEVFTHPMQVPVNERCRSTTTSSRRQWKSSIQVPHACCGTLLRTIDGMQTRKASGTRSSRTRSITCERERSYGYG